MKNNKGEGSSLTIGIFTLVVLAIFGVLWFFGFNFGAESEGVVDYEDCRQKITIKDNDWHRYFGKFVCDTFKSDSGKLMGGECVRIINDSSLFSSSHTCATVYIYDKNPELICPDTVNGYLGKDDKCHCNTDFIFNKEKNKCVETLESIWSK